MNTPENIEVYVEGHDTAPLLAFLERNVGRLSFVLEIVAGHNQYDGGATQLFISEHIADGYISVYLVGASKWASDLELARDMAKILGVTVRCDPGEAYPDVSPHSNIFVEICGEEESLVRWG